MSVSVKFIFMTILVVMNYACVNTPPVADAGQDQVTMAHSVVTLDGSNSNDANGKNLSFNWSLVAVPFGSMATLSDTTVETPNFRPDIGGIYRASLTVNNGNADSTADSITIIVSQRPASNLENVGFLYSDQDETEKDELSDELSYCD